MVCLKASFIFVGLVACLSTCKGRGESSAQASVGGYMSNCYNGTFKVGVTCEEKKVAANLQFEGREFVIEGALKASYLTPNGDKISFDYVVTVTDKADYYNPEASLPAVIRVVSSSGRTTTQRQYSTSSQSVIIPRVTGERVFVTQSMNTVIANGSSGSQIFGTLDKIEVLIPGVGGVGVLQF